VPFSRFWLLALMILLPGKSYSAPLSFTQALELALNRNDASGQGVMETGNSANAATPERIGQSCPIHLQDYAGIAARFATADSFGSPAGGAALSPAGIEPSGGAFDLRSRKNVILCTALVYSRFEGLAAQRQLLSRQLELVTRLMDIESRRVHVDVDNPVLLTQAKLLRATIRFESAALGASERKTRTALSALLDLPPNQIDQIDPVVASMPALPVPLTSTLEDNETLQQLMAYRDLVQLQYITENAHRLKTTQELVLAKASIATLVAAHVTEGITFLALLQLNNQIHEAKIQFLGASSDIESWAFRRARPSETQPAVPPEALGSPSPPQSGDSTSGAQPPALLSILISPAIKDLQVGKSQQFSAIATYSNGQAKDITSEANWSCSADTGAALSSTGLLTGLSAGALTVRVESQGLTHSRKLSITDQPIDEYLLPNH
jgi:hypothetical protein